MKQTVAMRRLDYLREKYKAERAARSKTLRNFTDLKVESNVAPCTNSFGNGKTIKRELPKDAKQFPVGHSHKQGLELITPKTELQWMGGKKS